MQFCQDLKHQRTIFWASHCALQRSRSYVTRFSAKTRESGDSFGFLTALRSEFSQLLKSQLGNSSQKQVIDLASYPGPLVVVSKLENPYLNLGIESFLYEKKPLEDATNCNRLFLYSNSRCIVFGKNQNPWKEINFRFLKSHNLLDSSSSQHFEIVRRLSGGGTVIHDKGNCNYGFITSKADFNRKTFSRIIVDVVNRIYRNHKQDPRSPLYPITINERGDLVALVDNKEYKISGSAYKVSKGRSYHHGTMLLNCDLNKFSNILSKNGSEDNLIVDNSVESKRARVTNLQMDEDLFNYALISGFAEKYGVEGKTGNLSVKSSGEEEVSELLEARENDNLKKLSFVVVDNAGQLPQRAVDIANELVSWDFKYGKTPKFEVILKGNGTKLGIEKGFIKRVEKEGVSLEVEPPVPYVGENLEYLLDEESVKQLVDDVP